MSSAELIVFQGGLPAAPIEEVSRFLLFAPEKLKSIKAEICYINKLDVAQEVLEQKQEEERQLAGLILDASVRIGELTKQMPTQSGRRVDLEPTSPEQPRFERPKYETIKNLGFSPSQVKKFELLAANKDLVEQVKTISRESGNVPTRAQVLKLAQQRKRAQEAPSPLEPVVVERMDRESERESIKRHVAELKDDTIERTYTTEMFMVEYRDYILRSIRGLEWYEQDPYSSLYSELSENEKQEMMALNTALLETIKSINKLLKG